ncbi:hypothetical protein GCM10007939_22360 [Amylibacter marinus]|uniref:Microcin J25-processing protein McjB C-terminal domain-containing protein n=1 Tax=Amylibacter marinus TaxID=1475483 RepID=A0ABQ5VX03_9RHOB|nr:lasso peptide biosynthesis B2 protein [Amylibacter marinus]GLQ35952.1 hypothetical protein GCM10007939_22360 [Amylibacter marinus]
MPSIIRTLLRKFRFLLKKPLFTLVWLPAVWLMLGAARAMILTVEFRRLARLLGRREGLMSAVPLLTKPQKRRARQIQAVIKLAARYTPWTSNCFPQAIAARVLLGLYGVPYMMFFGVNKQGKNNCLKAHAWVVSGPCAVAGGHAFNEYTVVGSFGADSWQKAGS